MCNKELAPVYEPTREEEGGEGADHMDPSVYHLALLVSLTICLVLFILLLTFAYLRSSKRALWLLISELYMLPTPKQCSRSAYLCFMRIQIQLFLGL